MFLRLLSVYCFPWSKTTVCVRKHNAVRFSHTHAVLAVWENSIRVGGCAVAVCLMEPQSDTTL